MVCHVNYLLFLPLDRVALISEGLSQTALGMLAANFGLLACPGRLVKTRATFLGASKDEQGFGWSACCDIMLAGQERDE